MVIVKVEPKLGVPVGGTNVPVEDPGRPETPKARVGNPNAVELGVSPTLAV